MTAGDYLNYIDAQDHLAPKSAVIRPPLPVIVVAQLNPLADQVFEARAICSFDFTKNGPQVVVQPQTAGGLVVEDMVWTLGLGLGALAYVTLAELAVVLPTTLVDRMDTGGPATKFITGGRDFEAGVGAGNLPNDGQLEGPVFVPPGSIFVFGRSAVGNVQMTGQMQVREIPVSPFGG